MEKRSKARVVDDQKICSSSKNPGLKSADQTVENKSAAGMWSTDESSDDQNQSQSLVENGSINDLLPEILVQILGKLDAPSLFACRLVNRQFCVISTEILCRRREVELKFEADKEAKKLMLVKNGKNSKQKKSLQDFVECMKQLKNCPFVRFSFYFANSSLSELDYFLAEFDLTKVKCFKLSFSWGRSSTLSYLYGLAEKMGDLLVNKIPQLEEFGLEMPCDVIEEDLLKLFSSSIQLPHLKVLHFGPSMFSKYRGIVGDLLAAAVNLETIQPCAHDLFYLSVSNFCFLHSLGKLDCVQSIRIRLEHEFIDEVRRRLPSLPNLLKLSKLKLQPPTDKISWCGTDTYPLRRVPLCWSDIRNFLSALLDSCKNSLESLEIEPLGFLLILQFPRFTKLEKLSLDQDFLGNRNGTYNHFFPPGLQFLDIFPVVRDLKLNIENWPEENFLPHLPNVERIELVCRRSLNHQIEQLASIYPNAKHLKITPDLIDEMFSFLESPRNFLQVGRLIATHLPKLESLELFIHLDSPENNFHAIDSFFTGFSQENCKRLFDSTFDEAVKKRDSDSNSGAKIIDSEFELIPEREHPSIYDMQNLKKLTVNPSFGENSVERKDFMDKLTWISKKYALELMPQLKITETEDDRKDRD